MLVGALTAALCHLHSGPDQSSLPSFLLLTIHAVSLLSFFLTAHTAFPFALEIVLGANVNGWSAPITTEVDAHLLISSWLTLMSTLRVVRREERGQGRIHDGGKRERDRVDLDLAR
jgi:uncharacterized membrane protein YjjP (DUF1212 family)